MVNSWVGKVEAGETVGHKGYWRNHIRNLLLLVTVGCYVGHACAGRTSVSLRSLQATWPK